jgi:LPS-assembly protein
VLRFDDKRQFAIPTGLSGGLSEWLIAANFRLDQQLHVLSRTLFEDDLDVSRSETRVTWRKDSLGLWGTYIWRKRDITERRFEDLSEFALAAAYGINDFWTTAADIRYDIDASTATRAGVGVRYQNECIGVDLSVSRRLTSSSNVDPVTDVDFEIFLTGFGTGGSPSAARRRCNG